MLPIARWAQRRRRQQHTTPGCPALSSPEWSASVPAGLRQLLDATFAQESEEVRTAVLQHFVDMVALQWASAPRAIGTRRDARGRAGQGRRRGDLATRHADEAGRIAVPTACPPARPPACLPACLPAAQSPPGASGGCCTCCWLCTAAGPPRVARLRVLRCVYCAPCRRLGAARAQGVYDHP